MNMMKKSMSLTNYFVLQTQVKNFDFATIASQWKFSDEILIIFSSYR